MTPPKCTVEITILNGTPVAYDLVDGSTIGRASKNDVVLAEKSVSGQHARVEFQDGGFVIMDLGSHNGIAADGGPTLRKGESLELSVGRTIKIGNCRLTVNGVSGARESLGETLPGGGEATVAPPPKRTEPETVAGVSAIFQKPAFTPPPVEVERPIEKKPIEKRPVEKRPVEKKPVESRHDESRPIVEKPEVQKSPADPAPTPPKPGLRPASEFAPVPSISVSADDPVLDDDSMGLTMATLVADGSGLAADVAALEYLREARPRLILIDPTGADVVRITSAETVVGRGRDAEIRLDSKQISSKHAKLTYSTVAKGLQLEDLGSANKTFVQRVAVAPGAPVLLGADSYVMFGPLEAVFRVQRRPDGSTVAADFDLRVARRLISIGKLTNRSLARARKEARKSGDTLGDALLTCGAVEPSAWAVAAVDTRLLPEVSSGGTNRWLIAVVVIAVLAAVAFGLITMGVIPIGAPSP